MSRKLNWLSAGAGYIANEFSLEASVRRSLSEPGATMIGVTIAYFLESSGLTKAQTQVNIIALDGTGPLAAAALAVTPDKVEDAVINTGGFRFGKVLDLQSPEFLPAAAKGFGPRGHRPCGPGRRADPRLPAPERSADHRRYPGGGRRREHYREIRHRRAGPRRTLRLLLHLAGPRDGDARKIHVRRYRPGGAGGEMRQRGSLCPTGASASR